MGFIYFSSQLGCPPRFHSKTSPRPTSERVSCLETSAIKSPFLRRISIPNSFVSLFIFYILSYLLLKTMGCFSGHLMSSASDQKLFCVVCSVFKCSFDEFVGDKVVSPSSSSAILAPSFPICFYLVAKSCPLFATPWSVVCQPPLSMGFSRQEYWSGLPFPPPGDLPNPEIKPASPVSAGRFFDPEPLGKFMFSYSFNLFQR